MTEGLEDTKKVRPSVEELEDLKEKLSDELQPIFDILNSIKTKEEISNFIKDQNSDTIKNLLNFIVIDSPNESTRLLKKLIDLVDNTMRAKPDALSTSIHYGVALEYLVVGPILIFKPEIILNIFKFSDVASINNDGNKDGIDGKQQQQYTKYQWLRIMGVFLTILGFHHFMEVYSYSYRNNNNK